MKNVNFFSIFNFIFLCTVGGFISYYGLFIGQSNMSYYVSACGALLIGYSIHSTAIIYTRFNNEKDKDTT